MAEKVSTGKGIKKQRDRAEPKFHLAQSRIEKINDVIKGYFVIKGSVSLETIANEVGQNKSRITLTHNFLKDIGVIDGTDFVKHITDMGRKLGWVLKYGTKEEVKESWREIINKNKFCIDLLNDIYPLGYLTEDKFRDRIYLLAGYEDPARDTAIGANALINIFCVTGYIIKSGQRFRVSKSFKKVQYEEHLSQAGKDESYISDSNIRELQRINHDKFDLTRLIRYCKEVNDNFKLGNYSSVAFICRAILDHIPPIFGEPNFESISAHTRKDSLKKTASHLYQSLKNIAEGHLPKQISEKEVLPLLKEVDFSAEMNFIIGRIIETLSKK